MSDIRIDREGEVAIVTLNRPQVLNALSRSLQEEIATTVRALDADETVLVTIITGAGDRAFSAGVDLNELSEDSSLLSDLSSGGDGDPIVALERCSKPVIAAINGVAITGGLELALACDMMIASRTARFADTHSRVGLSPTWGLSQKLPRLIGLPRAKEMSLTGGFLDAATAADWGLVNHVVEPDELMPRTLEIALSMAQAGQPFLSHYKALLDDGYALAFGEAMALEKERSASFNADIDPNAIAQRRARVQARTRS